MNEQDTIKQYLQIDISKQPPQSIISTAMLTKWEADTKNRALRHNGSMLKYVLKEGK
jgi:hypothetical protein